MSIIQPGGGGRINPRGAWASGAAYQPFDFVQDGGVGFLNGVAVGVPAASAQQWASLHAMTITTTNTANDTAHSTSGGGGNADALGNLGKTTGKWYFEFLPTGWADNGSQIGISVAAGILAGGNGISCQFGGTIASTAPGGGVGAFAGPQNGKRGAFAFDGAAALCWVSEDITVGTPNWNGAPQSGANGPASGLGGIAMGAMGAAVFPYFYIQSTPNQQTVLFTAPGSLLIPALPAGFSAMSAAGANPAPAADPTHWIG
jgi:hypothetical protein